MEMRALDPGNSIYAPPWLGDAACIGEDPDLFFGTDAGKFSGPKTKQAIAICKDCPVIKKCLSWALQTGDGFAVLGGMTPQQRTRYRRELEYTNSIRRMKN
jgi:WhiB family transcriptional regulator, redox-sensing transcriptional regulator